MPIGGARTPATRLTVNPVASFFRYQPWQSPAFLQASQGVRYEHQGLSMGSRCVDGIGG